MTKSISVSLPPETVSVGQLLSDLRMKKQLTQEGLADRAGITQSQLSRIERGVHAPNLVTLKHLVSALSDDATEERVFLHEIVNRLPSDRLTHVELRALTPEEALEHAREYGRRGDVFQARKYVDAMKRLAVTEVDMARSLIGLGICANDMGQENWAHDLFAKASKELAGVSEENTAWDAYLANLADLYCNMGNPFLADGLVKQLRERHPKNDFWRCWASFQAGRIALLNGDFPKAIELIELGIKRIERLADLSAHYAGWFKYYLASAMNKLVERRMEGLALLKELVQHWGPSEENPKHPEIFAKSCAELYLVTGNDVWKRKAQKVGRRMGYGRILRTIEQNKEVENESDSDSRAAGLGSKASRALIWVLFFLAVYALPSLAWAVGAWEF